MSLQIGICTSLDKVPTLAPGYDYLELGVSSTLVPLESESEYASIKAALESLSPPIRAFNLFIPGQLKVVGEDVEWDHVELYVERAIQRAAALGAKVIVFGSGGARAVPEDFSRALAWSQLVRFLSICADQAVDKGLIIAIEPLNRRESNIINTYREGVALAKDVARGKEVRVLADIYHFMMDAESLEDIAKEPSWLAHVHLADTGRRWPGSGSYPLERLFAILKDIDYSGAASIECRWGNDFRDETRRALSFLRSLAD